MPLSADAAFTYFFESCIEAGPKHCVLATRNKTAAQLEQDTWVLLESIRDNPVATGDFVFYVQSFKAFFVSNLLQSSGWKIVSRTLDKLLYGSQEEKQAAFQSFADEPLRSPTASFSVLHGLWGVMCGDKLTRPRSLNEAAEAFDKLRRSSKMSGDLTYMYSYQCQHWPWRAKEIYSGNFRVKTKNPILVLSSRFDAVTPLVSAQNVSIGLENSVLLVVNGVGVRNPEALSSNLVDFYG